MKRTLIYSVMALLSLPAIAQETYMDAELATGELKGTARYQATGGAFDALGADISTISTNPAGVGIFRHSTASVTAGLNFQSDAPEIDGKSSSYVSFDQVGFVYSTGKGSSSWVNFAFNYNKSRDFNYLLSASGLLKNASQNKLTYQKARNEVFISSDDPTFNIIDALYMDNLILVGKDIGYYPATDYLLDRQQKGYIGEYSFNLSGGVNNRIFWGITFGMKDVHYKDNSSYTESFEPGKYGGVTIIDDRRITGTGFDVTAGVIFRPIAESPFRVGLSVATPTFYDLRTKNDTRIGVGSYLYTNGLTGSGIGHLPGYEESYDFKMNTPWRFGLSLGHTIGTNVALGASYEYADYSAIDNRVNDGEEWDPYYGYEEYSVSDHDMNDHTKHSLRGVSTLKLGAEIKPIPELSLRIGYNYQSPIYKTSAYRDGSVWSEGTYYSSTTDYTNWKDTHRFTLGLGYNYKKWSFDMAYVYSQKKGEFYPFMSYYENADESPSPEDNIAHATIVNNKRNKVLLSLTYHF